MVVLASVPLVGLSVNVEPNPLPLVVEIWKPAGAVTVTLPARYAPETV